MNRHDPYRKRRNALFAALAADDLPPEYYARALDDLMKDESEQRDFVHSEFMPLDLVRRMLNGDLAPTHLLVWCRAHFRTWLREHRKYRVTTTAWALYAADHPTAPAPDDAGAM